MVDALGSGSVEVRNSDSVATTRGPAKLEFAFTWLGVYLAGGKIYAMAAVRWLPGGGRSSSGVP
jgi:hypothetical protein